MAQTAESARAHAAPFRSATRTYIGREVNPLNANIRSRDNSSTLQQRNNESSRCPRVPSTEVFVDIRYRETLHGLLFLDFRNNAFQRWPREMCRYLCVTKAAGHTSL